LLLPAGGVGWTAGSVEFLYNILYLSYTCTNGHNGSRTDEVQKKPKTKNREKEIYLSEVALFAAAAAAAAVYGEVGWRVWPRAADRRRLKRLNERTPKPADRQDRHTAINIERRSYASPSTTKQNSILLAMICHPKGERHSHSRPGRKLKTKINTPNLHSSETSAQSFFFFKFGPPDGYVTDHHHRPTHENKHTKSRPFVNTKCLNEKKKEEEEEQVRDCTASKLLVEEFYFGKRIK
jgi:hypothetical protein